MSDRSYASVSFYAATPAEWTKIGEIFGSHGGVSYDPAIFDTYPNTWPVEITDDEVRLSTLHEILENVAAQTNAVFWGAQDAYFEYPGDLDIQVEEGYFHGEPDNTGRIPLYDEHLSALIATAPSLTALESAIQEYTGKKFIRAANEWRTGTRRSQFIIDEQPTLEDK